MERLAKLEAIVASLAAGTPVEAPVAKPDRTAARLRGVRAYLALRASRRRIAELERAHANACRDMLDVSSARRQAERAEELAKAARECRDIALSDLASTQERLQTLWRRRGCARRIARRHIALRTERTELRLQLRDATETAGRLQIRADALERLQLDSMSLDRRPVETPAAPKPSIILATR